LVKSISSSRSNNCCHFLIFWSWNVKALSILNVYKFINFELKDLPPSRVSAPDLHVVSLSWTLDVPRLIVGFRSDS
jgi:hypothetical protein